MKALETHRLPACMCPVCGYLVDAASAANGASARPVKGDFSMCLACGAILQFDAFLALVRCDPVDLRGLELAQPGAYEKLRQAQQFVRTQKDWAPRDRRGGQA